MPLPNTDKLEAMAFVRAYAKKHLYFNGGEVLEEWRKEGGPYSKLDWRNKWGAVITAASRDKIIKKIGRVRPKNKQSHTTSLVLWESRVYKGTDKKVKGFDHEIKNLRSDVAFGKVTITEALWAAYSFGFEDLE